jgi:hypothetical protein
MLLQKFTDFLAGDVLTYAGSTSSEGIPAIHRVFGCEAKVGLDHLDLWIPDSLLNKLDRNLNDNDRVSATTVNVLSFEAYQFKGRAVGLHAGSGELAERQEVLRKRLMQSLVPVGEMAVKLIQFHDTFPCHVLTMEVLEIFDQSPKKGAGNPVAAGKI